MGRRLITGYFFRKKKLMALLFKIKYLSLQTQNQTGSFAMCALLSLYFKTFIFNKLSCI
jgi:hypothetical protein